VAICAAQLDEWAAADGPVDIAARGKDLSFEFSTQLLVGLLVRPAVGEAVVRVLLCFCNVGTSRATASA
jgi:hypothetical protein